MNKLLFILAVAALTLGLFFPLRRAFSPKGGVSACTQESGIFLGNFSLKEEFTTNVTAAFSVPWGLTLAMAAPSGIPKEGELWVRVTEPGTQELCLERLVAFKDAATVKAFGFEPALGLTFTFILENEEELKKIDVTKGPFFLAEGQKGVLPGQTYDWEIGVRSPGAEFEGSLWLTAKEVGARNAFLGRYTQLLSGLYAFFFSLIVISLVWLWHSGSLYRFVRDNLAAVLAVFLFGALSASAEKQNPALTFATPESDLVETLEVMTPPLSAGTLLRFGGGRIFSKGQMRIVIREGAAWNTLPLAGKCSLSSCFLDSLVKGEAYTRPREKCRVSALGSVSLEESSFMELTRHLGPPEIVGTGSCAFASWTFTDGSSLFAAYDGDVCYRLERQPNAPEYYLDLRRYGGRSPEWAKWPWRFFHFGMLFFLLLCALAVMARAYVFTRGAKKSLRVSRNAPKEA
ncbi:hypothetical protein IKW72_01860 [bacterium]|nr:hypothetical protein [bacterium]